MGPWLCGSVTTPACLSWARAELVPHGWALTSGRVLNTGFGETTWQSSCSASPAVLAPALLRELFLAADPPPTQPSCPHILRRRCRLPASSKAARSPLFCFEISYFGFLLCGFPPHYSVISNAFKIVQCGPGTALTSTHVHFHFISLAHLARLDHSQRKLSGWSIVALSPDPLDFIPCSPVQ